MLRTREAVIEADGQVRILESISLPGAHRALVTVLEEVGAEESGDLTAQLSAPALAHDWNRPEEDAAWAHLQRGA